MFRLFYKIYSVCIKCDMRKNQFLCILYEYSLQASGIRIPRGIYTSLLTVRKQLSILRKK